MYPRNQMRNIKNTIFKIPAAKAVLLFIFIALLFSYVGVVLLAAPTATKYAPGETLDPSCAPGTTNCSVTLGWEVDTANNYVYNTTDSIGIGTASYFLPPVDI